MAAVLHGSARTTPRIRAELQRSKESTRTLAARYQLNPKTVAKWRARQTTTDAAMGPRDPRSTILSPAEEAIIVEFRRRTLLPLDDVMGCLRDAIPKLTRSALHRCLQRHGISRLPLSDDTPKRGRFAETKIGFVHIDSCELRLAEGKLIMFLAIDRRGRYPEMEAMFGGHIFDRVCKEHGIEHRLTKPYHPWTNGQAERMNRTVKDATVKTLHYTSLDALKAHVLAFVSAYNSAKYIKAIKWKTPFQHI